ncbi:MAG: 4-(cytidine 5'-diphospho)-2-C-methyl-D-erythritol kinase [Bacteroidaceae bacterium]|nr:4-(cytidine 5'-diphospho)-2-C-methyl-D-erythritol kinase [Bacteroidaceae bacterium]
MITFPNAKINLGLNVVERRPDGYHNLETVFYPIPLQDILEVTTFDEVAEHEDPTNTDVVLHTGGIVIAGGVEDNLVVKAYRLLKAEFDLSPVHIHIFKHIPSGAGLGGGSADATYMLRLLREKFSLPLTDDELEERAARLGADCAFFVRNTPAFATGIGNIFTPLPDFSLKGYCILLVKPDIFVSTRDAFALIRPHKPERPLTEIITLPVNQWREAGMCNDFEESVFAKYPAIGEIKDKIYHLGAEYAAMSGSGSSLFGLFKKNNIADDTSLREIFPNCFCWQGLLEV